MPTTPPIQSMRDIAADLQRWWRFRTAGLTYYGQGVARGLVEAIARPLQQLEVLRYRGVQAMLVDTATATDLDRLGAERGGLTRLGAAASSVVVTFQGDVGAAIPSGTQLRSVSGIVFTTQQNITIGTANPLLLGMSDSEPLTDKAICQATTAGAAGNVPARTITALVSQVAGVTSLSNPVAAENGRDAETDQEFRARIKATSALSAQATQAFLEALAQAADPDVLRALARKSGAGLELLVLQRTGAPFTAPELSAISAYMAPRTKSLLGLTVANLPLRTISVAGIITLRSGYTLQEAFVQVADALAVYLDWRTWMVGADVDQAAVVARISDAAAIERVDEATVSPSSDVVLADTELPRLASVVLTDSYTREVVGGAVTPTFL